MWIKGSGQVLFRSPVAQDTYEYEYNSLALPSVDVEQDPVLTITLADSDLSDDDLAARWTLSLLKLQDLPAEGLAVPLEDHGAHVSLWVRPVD